MVASVPEDIDPRNEYVPQPPSPYREEKVIAEVSISRGRLQVYVNRREVDEHSVGRALIKAGAYLIGKHLPKVEIFTAKPEHKPTTTKDVP